MDRNTPFLRKIAFRAHQDVTTAADHMLVVFVCMQNKAMFAGLCRAKAVSLTNRTPYCLHTANLQKKNDKNQ